MNTFKYFFNQSFTKKKLTQFILWYFTQYGENKTLILIEKFKKHGFQYSTQAGVSISLDDLKIPFIKDQFITNTEQKLNQAEFSSQMGYLTEIEKLQNSIREWYRVSEDLKIEVIHFFQATDIFNPVYMMAFSGARGNISQVRQLVGMRGLMSDPQGRVLNFPIRSNLREGLTLTEYLISCYGARKGIVDTALRTATSGYLTRRLVDVTQHVIIGQKNCHTTSTIVLKNLMDGAEMVLPLRKRLIGRILGENVICQSLGKEAYIGLKNYEISSNLALKISQLKTNVKVRSPLTCLSENAVCQFCYGWNLARGKLVSLGDSIGILAAQSIGEPGTQLTMRTFHTGGVFTGKLFDQIYAPFNGKINYLDLSYGRLVRTLQGQIGFLTKTKERLQIIKLNLDNDTKKKEGWGLRLSDQAQKNRSRFLNHDSIQIIQKIEDQFLNKKLRQKSRFIFNLPVHTILFLKQGSIFDKKQLIAEFLSEVSQRKGELELEYEANSPISAQVYFEKLVLIEKTRRHRSLQNTTYSLGFIWLIEGLVFTQLLTAKPFIKSGDIINNFSILQKITILNPSFYFIDQKFPETLKPFNSIQDKNVSSSIKKKQCFFLKRLVLPFFLKKFYYKEFQYFAVFKTKKNQFKNTNFSFINYDKNHKNDNNKYYQSKNLIVTLNCSIFQNTNSFFKKDLNSQFCFHLHYSTLLKNKIESFFQIQISVSLFQKLRPKISIISLKKWKNQKFKFDHYQFWVFFIKKIKFLNLMKLPWQRYQKKYSYQGKTFFNGSKKLFLNSINSRNLFSFSKTKKKKNFFSYNQFYISKKFYKYVFILKLFSPLISLFDQKYWYCNSNLLIMKLNRQGEMTFFSSSFFTYLMDKNDLQLNLIFLSQNLDNSSNLQFLFLKLKKQIVTIKSWKEDYRKHSGLKPIIFHFQLIQTIFKKKFNFFSILNIFLISNSFYLPLQFQSQKLQKNKYLTIGLKSVFRLFSLPKLKALVQYKPITKKLTRKRLKLLPLKLVEKDNFFNNGQKNPIFSEWFYLTPLRFFIPYLGFPLNYGFPLPDQIIFDNQIICADFIQQSLLNLQKLLKHNFQNNKKYICISNSRKRFSIIFLNSSNLIFFYKVLPSISFASSKRIFDKTLIDPVFLNFLLTNQIFNFSNSLKKQCFLSSPLHFGLRKSLFLDKKFNIFKFFYMFQMEWSGVFKQKHISSTNVLQLSVFSPIYIFGKDTLPFKIRHQHSYFKFQLIQTKKIHFSHLNVFFKFQPTQLKIMYQGLEIFSTKSKITISFFMDIKISEIRKKDKKNNFILISSSNLATFTRIQEISNNVKIGNFIRPENKIGNSYYYTNTGQVIYIDSYKIILRKAVFALAPNRGILNISHDELIHKNKCLFTFLYQQTKTGDIIQGIPKIEQLFEARSTKTVLNNLHLELRRQFYEYSTYLPKFKAAKKSFKKIQRIIIDEIQKIYCSQGVSIADKHLEVVIRQMTSKVQIIDEGGTGLLDGELINLKWIELMNKKLKDQKIKYEPILLGITKASLETGSFISAASFQETIRVLTNASVQNKIDFIRGLKPNVILGNLIPAGTGLLYVFSF